MGGEGCVIIVTLFDLDVCQCAEITSMARIDDEGDDDINVDVVDVSRV